MNKKDKVYQCYKKYILEEAKLKFLEVRKRKYSLQYYLDNFIRVLNDVTKWESLSLINQNENTYHWKSIYNEFKKWTAKNVFIDAHHNFLQNNYFKISRITKSKKLNIFVD